MRTTLNTAFYAILNVRYGALILPTGVVAYLLGVPAWMVVTAAVLLALAVAAELFTSVVNGMHTAYELRTRDELLAGMSEEAERFANGGWLGLDLDDDDDDDDDGDGGVEVKREPLTK